MGLLPDPWVVGSRGQQPRAECWAARWAAGPGRRARHECPRLRRCSRLPQCPRLRRCPRAHATDLCPSHQRRVGSSPGDCHSVVLTAAAVPDRLPAPAMTARRDSQEKGSGPGRRRARGLPVGWWPDPVGWQPGWRHRGRHPPRPGHRQASPVDAGGPPARQGRTAAPPVPPAAGRGCQPSGGRGPLEHLRCSRSGSWRRSRWRGRGPRPPCWSVRARERARRPVSSLPTGASVLSYVNSYVNCLRHLILPHT